MNHESPHSIVALPIESQIILYPRFSRTLHRESQWCVEFVYIVHLIMSSVLFGLPFTFNVDIIWRKLYFVIKTTEIRYCTFNILINLLKPDYKKITSCALWLQIVYQITAHWLMTKYWYHIAATITTNCPNSRRLVNPPDVPSCLFVCLDMIYGDCNRRISEHKAPLDGYSHLLGLIRDLLKCIVRPDELPSYPGSQPGD